jgi:hypothetical protein
VGQLSAEQVTRPDRDLASAITGFRVVVLILVWLGVVFALAPRAGLYYEVFAAWLVLPPLGLIYVYCVAHRGRASATLAVVATAVAALVIALAVVMPHASAV